MRMSKKGQSVLEYVIVLTAIIAVIVAGAATVLRPAVQNTLNSSGQTIQNAAARLPQ
jgi:Flp pilus assembly pilin Flp